MTPPTQVQDELPPLPLIATSDCIPYEAIRYVAGYTVDFCREYATNYARTALAASRAADEGLMRDAAEALEEIERHDDQHRNTVKPAIAALRARLQGDSCDAK